MVIRNASDHAVPGNSPSFYMTVVYDKHCKVSQLEPMHCQDPAAIVILINHFRLAVLLGQ